MKTILQDATTFANKYLVDHNIGFYYNTPEDIVRHIIRNELELANDWDWEKTLWTITVSRKNAIHRVLIHDETRKSEIIVAFEVNKPNKDITVESYIDDIYDFNSLRKYFIDLRNEAISRKEKKIDEYQKSIEDLGVSIEKALQIYDTVHKGKYLYELKQRVAKNK